MQGKVYGGQQPVTGSKVYLFAVGTAGYSATASSLLTGSGVTVDSAGNGYVTSDASGTFSITGDYSCPSASSQIYILARGGNPGLSGMVDNASLVETATLGSCGGLSSSTSVNVTELTTVAAAYSLAQFAVTNSSQNSSSTGFTTSTTNVNGATYAMGTANVLLAEVARLSGGPIGNVTDAVFTLNTLADVISACVNSNGTDGQCANLMSLTTPSGGTAPTDTLQAVLSIAHNPTLNVSAIFALAPAIAPFQPTYATAPNDWLLRLEDPSLTPAAGLFKCTLSAMSNPQDYATDAGGLVWRGVQYSSPSASATTGYYATDPTDQQLPGSPFTLNAFNGLTPTSFAIDQTGKVWSVGQYCPGNTGSSTATPALAVLNPAATSGVPFSLVASGMPSLAQLGFDNTGRLWVTQGMAFGTGTPASYPNPLTASATGNGTANAIAFDGLGNLWAANQENTLSKYALSGSGFATSRLFTGGGLNGPAGLALDHSGNVWITNATGNSLSKFDPNGNAISSSAGYTGGGLNLPQGVTIDGLGNVWVSNQVSNSNTLSEFDSSGNALSPSSGFAVPSNSLNTSGSIAIDASGNLWTGGVEFIGAAAPVVTPMSIAVREDLLGVRP